MSVSLNNSPAMMPPAQPAFSGSVLIRHHDAKKAKTILADDGDKVEIKATKQFPSGKSGFHPANWFNLFRYTLVSHTQLSGTELRSRLSGDERYVRVMRVLA